MASKAQKKQRPKTPRRDPGALDRQFVWHPFTQMQDWARTRPIVIQSGEGAILRDDQGKEYLDANASIWTNLHGHRHPKIDQAIRSQLDRISHSSALGLANEPASILAAELIKLCRLRKTSIKRDPRIQAGMASARQPKLSKVFFSDDGSTAIEAALKMHHQHTVRSRPNVKPRYLSLESSYHGDTVGAMSLSHSPLFHRPFSKIRFPVDRVMAPYCYRCPFNRAKPTRNDARLDRQCQWECIGSIEKKLKQAQQRKRPYTAFIFEPLIQGAAGMIAHPRGYLARAERLTRRYGLQLIADEVLTGFGRTGSILACHQEGVQPDFLAVAKGLTGGYLPMAATLTTDTVYQSFLGPYDSFRTFFHGHSFTGNQLGGAAALANLEILNSKASVQKRAKLERWFEAGLQELWALPQVGDIRRVGLVAGIEVVEDHSTRKPYPLSAQAGIRICQVLAKYGVLTRSIGNVVTVLLIYTMTKRQVTTILKALKKAIEETLPR